MATVDTPPLERVCASVGLDCRDARLLHVRANYAYHLPGPDVVARLRRTHGSEEWQRRLTTAVQVIGWLSRQGFPTVEPLPIMPLSIDGWVATFWRYLETEGEVTAGPAELARLLRDLHALSAPPVELVPTNPLGALPADIEHADEVLSNGQSDWLRTEADQIAQDYALVQMPLGYGLIHGDAYEGNLIRNEGRWLLGDWDSVSTGPRAQDLVPTLVSVTRFGRPYSDWVSLCTIYGVMPEIAEHPGMRLLCRARELRSLAAYIRTAPARADVRTELNQRLDTLIHGVPAIWRAI